MFNSYDPLRQLTQTDSQEMENEEADLGEDSRADLVFKGDEVHPCWYHLDIMTQHLAQYRPGSACIVYEI
jgi:hypothetical protein